MIKQTLLVLGMGVAATFTCSSADAFFGHRGHHRSSGCGGNYYATPTYSTGYSPYASQATYSRSNYRPSYGYGRSYGYGNTYGYGRTYGYGNRGYQGYGYNSYRPSYSGYGYSRYRNPYAGYGYRGYSSRFGGYSGLMGYGNGYYYGGFPTARASGIGIVPRVGYGW